MERNMESKEISEAKIAWVLCQALEEITERLWLRYDKDFIRMARQQEEEDIRAAEKGNEINPLPLAQDDF
jgi:hypothetical protein